MIARTEGSEREEVRFLFVEERGKESDLPSLLEKELLEANSSNNSSTLCNQVVISTNSSYLTQKKKTERKLTFQNSILYHW